jgi:hypothetical protein
MAALLLAQAMAFAFIIVSLLRKLSDVISKVGDSKLLRCCSGATFWHLLGLMLILSILQTKF